jgi:hypothetical protein
MGTGGLNGGACSERAGPPPRAPSRRVAGPAPRSTPPMARAGASVGGAACPGRGGLMVTRGGESGPMGWRAPGGMGGAAGRSVGRSGAPGLGLPRGRGAAGRRATVAAGTTGSMMRGSGPTSSLAGASGSGVGSGTSGFGLTMVAAGFSSTGASSAGVTATPPFRARAALASAPSTTDALSMPSPALATFGREGLLGLGSSGSSRPLPSLTRRALASPLSSGVMARTPLCPISSAATIRSLLVTPSSLARSMTFTLPAATAPSLPQPGSA